MSQVLPVVQPVVLRDRDAFLRTLLRHLTGALQDVIGLEEASGFVSLVGQLMGEEIDAAYRVSIAAERLNREQVTRVLVDLKQRIGGDFYVIEQNDDRVVLGNRRCPFEDDVHGRPSLCMMTSNVFGRIAADNLGYAKVSIEEAIAAGAPRCRIVIYLKPAPEAELADGREYFRAGQ